MDRERVSGDHRHAHTGRRHPKIRKTEDLAGLVADLQLLRRPAVVLERPGPRHHVHGQRGGERPQLADRGPHVARPGAQSAVRGDLRDLVVQGVDPLLARTGGGLVGADHQVGEPVGPVQRADRHDHRQRGAVRVADDAARPVPDLFAVDLGYHQRHVVVQPERAGVVDGDRAPRHRDRSPLLRHLVGDVEHRHVHPVEDLRSQCLDLDLLTAHGEPLARGTGRRHQADLPPHVLAGGEDVQHDSAHGAGSPDDGESGKTVAHRPVPP